MVEKRETRGTAELRALKPELRASREEDEAKGLETEDSVRREARVRGARWVARENAAQADMVEGIFTRVNKKTKQKRTLEVIRRR